MKNNPFKKTTVLILICITLIGFSAPISFAQETIKENTKEEFIVPNDNGSIARIEQVASNEMIVHEDNQDIKVRRGQDGNIYVNNERVTNIKESSTEDLTSLARASYKWVYGGMRKYSMSFVNKSRATAAAMLTLIPGWGAVAAATAEIAIIWTSGKQLWFQEDTQIDSASKGAYKRMRTRTYRKSNYTKMSKDTGWSGAIRIHW